MPETIARACIGGLLAVGLSLGGCGQSPRTANPGPLPAPEVLGHAPDDGPASREIPTPQREFRQSPPAAVVFVEYVATPHDVVTRMLELARLRPDDVVYDLGCGDGRILIAAAKAYGCRAVGFDLDPLRIEEARAGIKKNRLGDRVTVELKDVLAVDLREATVVTLYLGTELNRNLVPQLKQLRPGSRIVSHNFGLEGFPPDNVVRMTSSEDHEDHLIYLWTCPLGKSP